MSHNHGYTKTKQVRFDRKVRAEAVAAESGYSKLTTQQKLDRVLAYISVPGRGSAAKQLARLRAMLNKEQAPVKEKVTEAGHPAIPLMEQKKKAATDPQYRKVKQN